MLFLLLFAFQSDSNNLHCSKQGVQCRMVSVVNFLEFSKLYSRDMKTQHLKFEILKERLSLFYCNHIQLNFVLNMLSIGQICKQIFHPFEDVKDDVTRSLDVCHRSACESIVSKLLEFDRVYDLHFRIQTNFGQISSTQRRKRKTLFLVVLFRVKFS